MHCVYSFTTIACNIYSIHQAIIIWTPDYPYTNVPFKLLQLRSFSFLNSMNSCIHFENIMSTLYRVWVTYKKYMWMHKNKSDLSKIHKNIYKEILSRKNNIFVIWIWMVHVAVYISNWYIFTEFTFMLNTIFVP